MLNSKSRFVVAVFGLLLSANISNSAFADSDAKVSSKWAARVAEKISEKMIYPRSARGRTGHAVAELLVASDGTVIEAKIIKASDRQVFNIAAKRSLKRVSRLPFPPHNFTNDKVRVRVDMIYARRPTDVSRLAERLEASRKSVAAKTSLREGSPLLILVASN